MEPCVSVIVPSHNRAAILPETIPTYLQDGVAELIIIDDASTDNTAEVVRKLQQKYPQIRYYRNEKNLRQTGSQNRALGYVMQEYVYFGDDDSILIPGTIPFLLDAMEKCHADVMGALPLYTKSDDDIRHASDFIERKAPVLTVQEWKKKLSISHMEKLDFFFRAKEPCRVPFTHACALVKTEWAKRASFDRNFGGNSYREETDYWLQLSEQGASIYFAASEHAVQINLPYSRIGRSRTIKSMWKHGKYDLVNTLKLINKHYDYFRDKLGYSHSKSYMKFAYVFFDVWMYVSILPNRLVGMLLRKK